MFGDIDFGKHVLKPGILESIPRFNKGEPYNSNMLETFRNDLWKTGYFTDVTVQEVSQPDEGPPEVDLKVTLETDHKNSYRSQEFIPGLAGCWHRHGNASAGTVEPPPRFAQR
jgi:outer membrane translocation and assembly module TamA